MTRDHLPDLATLDLLVRVARSGSIGAAARALGVSQQAASQRLAGAERQIGVALLRRGSRGTETTPAGAVVVEWAAGLLDAADQVASAITALRAERDRELRLAASMTVAEHLLPRWLVTLRQLQRATRRPVASVSLRAANSRDVLTAVHDGSADLGFVEGVDRPSAVRSRTLVRDELVLVAAPSDRLARRRTPLSPDQVAALPMTSREPGSGTRAVVEHALAAHGLTMAAPAVELTTSTGIRETVRAGGSPGFLSLFAIEADLAAGALIRVPVAELIMTRSIRAVWVGGRTPPAGPVRDLIAVAGREPASRRPGTTVR